MSFECGSWDIPLKTSLATMWELKKPSWCPHPNAGLIWDMTADVALDLDDDASLHDSAVIHLLLAMKVAKKNGKPATESFEGGSPSICLKQGACLASSCGMEGHACGTGHYLNMLSEQPGQPAKLYRRLSMSDKSEMELIADCHGVTEVNFITALGLHRVVGTPGACPWAGYVLECGSVTWSVANGSEKWRLARSSGK